MQLIATLLMVAVLLGGMVGFLAVLFYGSHWWNLHEGKKWQAAAHRLGLTLEPCTPHHRLGVARFFKTADGPFLTQKMRGQRAGMNVEIGVRIVTTGSGKNRRTHYYTYARADLPRPLGLGIALRPQGLLARAVTAVVGARDLEIGNPTIDPAFGISAVEPEGVRSLLRVPYVAESLAWLSSASFRPYVSDDAVRCERNGKCFDAGALGIALDSAVGLAQRLLAARAEIGPSSAERAFAQAWRAVASARGFALDEANGRMSGRCEGMYVEVESRLEKQRRWTRFTVRFDRPLGVGLQLTRQSSLHAVGKLFGMQDIEVGDPVFDARFIVKGKPPASVQALLTPQVRQRLVELQDQAGRLEVQDDRLSAVVGWLVSDAAWLESGIVAVARAGASLAQVSVHDIGPYR